MSNLRTVTSVLLWMPGGDVRFHVGNDIQWSNPLGIGGVLLAATVCGLQAWVSERLCGEPNLGVVWLDVRPNELLATIIRKIPADTLALTKYPKWSAARGDGGPLFLTGETFYRDAQRGWIEVVGPLCHCTPGYRCIPDIAIHRKDCPLTAEERAMTNGPTRTV